MIVPFRSIPGLCNLLHLLVAKCMTKVSLIFPTTWYLIDFEHIKQEHILVFDLYTKEQNSASSSISNTQLLNVSWGLAFWYRQNVIRCRFICKLQFWNQSERIFCLHFAGLWNTYDEPPQRLPHKAQCSKFSHLC